MRELTQDALYHSLAGHIDDLAQAKILCIGDVMLDRFFYGHVERVSPEAPIPVMAIEREVVMLGGAGNVVRNIISLGAEASFISVVGDDKTGTELLQMVGREERLHSYIITEKSRLSTRKSRYIASNQQLLRADKETREAIKPATEAQLIKTAEEEIPGHDLVILSDYGKGVLTEKLVAAIIAKSKAAGKKVLIDPKSRDFSRYTGAYLLSPNLGELAASTGREIKTEEDIIEAARHIIKTHKIEHVLVTRSKDGMTLVSKNGDVGHITAQAREIFDVSGAGDTAIATLAVAHASGCSLPEAAALANIAAGIVVGKVGTAVVYRTDLKTALYTQHIHAGGSKIMPVDVAQDQIAIWRDGKLKVGFTNGCFDIMHSGHLDLLRQARAQCDRLIVAVNSDASVKRLNKGPDRPVNAEMDRAMMLAALSMVDLVVIFREDTPLELMKKFRPDVIFKGADYTRDKVVGGDFVESYGGEVFLIPLKEGYSTTKILSRAGKKN